VASHAEQHLESPGTKVYMPKEAKELLHEFADVQVKPAVTAMTSASEDAGLPLDGCCD